MKGHVIVHTGEKPYSCSQWVKSFAHASNLKKRVRIHTGGRPYSCSQCIKLFLHVGDVKKRVRIHNGEKPYSCSHCTKSFSQASNFFRSVRLTVVVDAEPAPLLSKTANIMCCSRRLGLENDLVHSEQLNGLYPNERSCAVLERLMSWGTCSILNS